MEHVAYVGLTRDQADAYMDDYRNMDPQARFQLVEQDGGLWALAVDWTAPVALAQMSAAPIRPAAAAAAPRPAARSGFQLGSLSAQYESNGRPGAIGYDRVGGFSYGAYQIAANTGTLSSFLTFLANEYPEAAASLQTAGGNPAGRQGTPAFKSAWKTLATDPKFNLAQHDFIKATHYDPFASKLRDELALDLAKRTDQLRNVAWSVAVQHGPANSIFKNALAQRRAEPALEDKAIINAVYDERSRVDVYFRRSSDRVKAAIRERYVHERRQSLKGL